MGEIHERLLQIRDRLGLSQAQMAKQMGVGQRTYSRYESGERDIPSIAISKIAQMGNIDYNWLITGEETSTTDHIPDVSDTYLKPDKKPTQIKYYPEIYASAGYGANNDDEGAEIMTLEHFMLTTLQIIDPSQIEIIRIHGDSMEPDFRNGEYVIAERVPGIEAVKTGNVIIANISGEIFIKRIEKIPFQERIILKSCNNAYDPIIIEGSNLKHLTITAIVRGSVKPH